METNVTPELIKAFVKAQSQFKSALKDATNPHLKSKYADLASIWDACKDALHENGLVVSQQTAGSETGWHLITRLYHEAGGYLESTTPILAPANANAQQFGSGITYSRRYALAAILGIVTDDDDAEGTMNRNGQPTQQKQAQKQQLQAEVKASPEQVAKIEHYLSHALFTPSESDPDNLKRLRKAYKDSTAPKAEKAIEWLAKELDRRENYYADEAA